MWTKEDQKKSDQAFRERRRARTHIETPISKICSGCLIDKPASEFTRDKISKDGLKFHCKTCTKKEGDA